MNKRVVGYAVMATRKDSTPYIHLGWAETREGAEKCRRQEARKHLCTSTPVCIFVLVRIPRKVRRG